MKKLLFKTSTEQVYSHSVDSFIGVRFLSANFTLATFLFNSDDNTEIHAYGIPIQLNKDLEFLRDLQDNLSFSKKSSVVIYDAFTDYSLSSYAATGGDVARSVIPSPSILNGNIDITLTSDYNVTAGDLTALADLLVTGNAQVNGDLNVDGDVTFEGSLVDSSSTPPTATSNGSSIMTVDGKDSVGKVTFTAADAAENDSIVVTYGTASTNTRVPVINPVGDIDIVFALYDNSSFTVKVGPAGVVAGGTFTYITQDHA